MTTERKTYVITIDDDPMVSHMIQQALGMSSVAFTSRKTLMARMDRYEPTAVFVDVHLNVDESGLDLIPDLRLRWPYCPIIVVTGGSDENAIGAALAAGADDFVRKPITRAELVARLQVRMSEMQQRVGREVESIGPLVFNRQQRTIESPSERRHLTHTECLILDTLIKAKGMTVSKDDLRRRVWGSVKVSASAVDKKIHDVRHSIQDLSPAVTIVTTYGVGIALVVKAGTEKEDPPISKAG